MPTASEDFRVVCLGGSAGALQAYMGILLNLATDTGMAFVVAPHRGFDQAYFCRKYSPGSQLCPS